MEYLEDPLPSLPHSGVGGVTPNLPSPRRTGPSSCLIPGRSRICEHHPGYEFIPLPPVVALARHHLRDRRIRAEEREKGPADDGPEYRPGQIVEDAATNGVLGGLVWRWRNRGVEKRREFKRNDKTEPARDLSVEMEFVSLDDDDWHRRRRRG